MRIFKIKSLAGMSTENKFVKNIFNAIFALVLLAANALAQEINEPIHRPTPVPVQQVTIDDPFWSPKLKVWRQVTLQDCFSKFDRDSAFTNFDRVRDGKSGSHDGHPWYDGLIYEMIRASANFLAAHPDPELKKQVDGYIETWAELMAPDLRWGLNGEIANQEHNLTQ
jgi:hypothetical protein